jgi:hypothetical protein
MQEIVWRLVLNEHPKPSRTSPRDNQWPDGESDLIRDFAVDLRASLAAVSRLCSVLPRRDHGGFSDTRQRLENTPIGIIGLPVADEALVDAVCEAERSAAANPAGEDQTVFWLVLADQFEKLAYPAGAYAKQPWPSSTAARTRR